MIRGGRILCRLLPRLIPLTLLLLSMSASAQSGLHVLADGSFLLASDGAETLFTSSDGGRLWQQLEELPQGVRYGYFSHPLGGAWLALSTGLYWSDDGLADWERITAEPVAWVLCSPSGQTTLFKKWGRGLFWAAEAGLRPGVEMNTHQSIPLPVNDPLQAAAVTPHGLYAGFFGPGVFFYDTGQEAWLPSVDGLRNTNVLTLVVGSDHQLLAGTLGGGLYRMDFSDKPTAQWELADSSLAGSIIDHITVGQDGVVLASGPEGDGAVSMDGGSTWQVVEKQEDWESGLWLQATAIDRWWALSRSGDLFVTADQGDSWLRRPYAFTQRIQQVAVDPSGRIWAAVTGSGVFSSEDGGRTWSAEELPEAWSPDNQLAAARDGVYYAAVFSGRLWHLPRNGSEWVEIPDFWGGVPFFGITSDAKGRLYLLTRREGGLYVREEGEWQRLLAEAPTEHRYMVGSLLFHPQYTLALGAYQMLMQSHDGQSDAWASHPFGQRERRTYFDRHGRLVTERQLSAFIWDDRAQRWQVVDSPAADHQYRWFVTLENGQVLAVNRTGSASLLQEDQSVGISVVELDAEILDVASGTGSVLMGTTQGLYRSVDGGQTWKRLLPGIELP